MFFLVREKEREITTSRWKIVVERRNVMESVTMIITLFNIVIVIAGVSAAAKSKEDSCDQPLDKLRCNVLYDVIQSDGIFSIRKETLENNCTALLDSFRCLRDYWAKCNPISLENLVMYMSGVKQIMEDLCDPHSKLRKDYDQHILCLTSSSSEMQSCTHVAEQKVRVLMKDNPHLRLLSVSAYRCLAHIELVGCVRNAAQERCGADAGQLIGGLVERSVRPYRYLRCHLFEHLKQPSKKEDYKMPFF